jgi:hypothetical protein
MVFKRTAIGGFAWHNPMSLAREAFCYYLRYSLAVVIPVLDATQLEESIDDERPGTQDDFREVPGIAEAGRIGRMMEKGTRQFKSEGTNGA